MGKTIFLDLDGPVIDVSRRYYAVHREILKDIDVTPAPYAVYWEGKRKRQALDQIEPGLADPSVLSRYRVRWLESIEDRRFLYFDQMQQGAAPALQHLRGEGFQLVAATLRQQCDNLLWELERLGVRGAFDEILCSGDTQSAEGWILKRRLIETAPQRLRDALLLVGDTEVDVLAARALGLASVAVLNGIRSRDPLAGVSPDFIIRDLAELVSILPRVCV